MVILATIWITIIVGCLIATTSAYRNGMITKERAVDLTALIACGAIMFFIIYLLGK